MEGLFLFYDNFFFLGSTTQTHSAHNFCSNHGVKCLIWICVSAQIIHKYWVSVVSRENAKECIKKIRDIKINLMDPK